ncbi:MAG: hypothetical protein MJY62_06090 [Bacteroidales bacterium]|nr:hypothetical protein [Bacteroidales bacterium]
MEHIILNHSKMFKKEDCANCAAFAKAMTPGMEMECFNISGFQDDFLIEGDAWAFIRKYIRALHEADAPVFHESVRSRRHLARIIGSIVSKGLLGWRFWGLPLSSSVNRYSSACFLQGGAEDIFRNYVTVRAAGSAIVRSTFRRRAVLPENFKIDIENGRISPECMFNDERFSRLLRSARTGRKKILDVRCVSGYDFLCGMFDDKPDEKRRRQAAAHLSGISMRRGSSMDYTMLGISECARMAVIAKETFALGCSDIAVIMNVSKEDAAGLLALGYSLQGEPR